MRPLTHSPTCLSEVLFAYSFLLPGTCLSSVWSERTLSTPCSRSDSLPFHDQSRWFCSLSFWQRRLWRKTIFYTKAAFAKKRFLLSQILWQELSSLLPSCNGSLNTQFFRTIRRAELARRNALLRSSSVPCSLSYPLFWDWRGTVSLNLSQGSTRRKCSLSRLRYNGHNLQAFLSL